MFASCIVTRRIYPGEIVHCITRGYLRIFADVLVSHICMVICFVSWKSNCRKRKLTPFGSVSEPTQKMGTAGVETTSSAHPRGKQLSVSSFREQFEVLSPSRGPFFLACSDQTGLAAGPRVRVQILEQVSKFQGHHHQTPSQEIQTKWLQMPFLS